MRIFPQLAIAVLVLAPAACSTSKDAENPGGSTGGCLLSRATNAVGAIDAGSAFLRASAAQPTATSYRMKMEMHAQGQNMTSLTEVECPDKLHNTADYMGRKMDSYQIGDTLYMNTGGSWKSMRSPSTYDCHGHITGGGSGRGPSGSSGGGMDVAEFNKKIQEAKDKYEFKRGGVITVEGEPCQQYSITSKDPNDKMKPMEFCVGTKDDLLRQMKMETMTITYYDWNKPLGLKPPM